MCLAALINKVNQREDFDLTNYAAFLENNPPRDEVKLRSGEEGRGSSWSCVHGVSRWYKDCGCSTGAEEEWNQKWRTPLREAFQYLNSSLKKIYEEKAASLFSAEPHGLRNEYIHVLTGNQSIEELLERYAGTGKKERVSGSSAGGSNIMR